MVHLLRSSVLEGAEVQGVIQVMQVQRAVELAQLHRRQRLRLEALWPWLLELEVLLGPRL